MVDGIKEGFGLNDHGDGDDAFLRQFQEVQTALPISTKNIVSRKCYRYLIITADHQNSESKIWSKIRKHSFSIILLHITKD